MGYPSQATARAREQHGICFLLRAGTLEAMVDVSSVAIVAYSIAGSALSITCTAALPVGRQLIMVEKDGRRRYYVVRIPEWQDDGHLLCPIQSTLDAT